MDTTEHDLKLLSIGYYIQGGIITFYALLALCYVGFVSAVLTSLQNSGQMDARNQIPPGVLAIIGAIVTAMVLIAVASGICLLYSGLALRRHKHRTFLLVIATLSCLAIPYGTVLGIFTFMVLQRPAAKYIFGEAPPQPPPLPQTY